MPFSPAQRQALSWTSLAFVFVVLLWLLAPVLTPFLVAAVVAYALQPAVERLVHRRVPRVVAVVLVEVAAIVVVLAVVLLIVPILSRQLPMLRDQVPLLADRLNNSVTPWLSQYGLNVALDITSIKAFVVKYLDANLEEWLATLLSSARIGGSVLLAVVGNAVLVPVVLFYLLMDWPELLQRGRRMVPRRFRETVDGFFAECDAVLGQFLRGQVLVMLLMAAYYAIGLALFGFDLALPVGVFTGLFMAIPYLGFGLGMVLALLAGILQFAGFYGVLAVAAVYGVGQVLESFVLTPRLVGERIGLSPLAVIFALLAFGHLLGFVGVLVALPLSALLVVAFRRLRTVYMSSRMYLG